MTTILAGLVLWIALSLPAGILVGRFLRLRGG